MTAIKTANSPPSARLSCLHALTLCLEKKLPLENTWGEDAGFATLPPQDKAFAQRLARTTIRHLGQIDDVLSKFLEQPLHDKAPIAMHVLRMGTAQLLWMEIPAHAAVHSSVELAKESGQYPYTGLVNAVLKNLSEQGHLLIKRQKNIGKLNTPLWLWKNWVEAHGEDTAENIARAHMLEAPLDISVKSDADAWAKKLGGEVLPEGSVRIAEPPAITQMEGFEEGHWWVQDVAATIPAQLLGDIKGKRVIDLCAAPGGKTAQLIAAGAKVTAVEISKNRMSILKSNLARLQMDAECIVADAYTWKPDFTPDAILLDAPCSATGTLRRHPDVALNKTAGDITRLAATQKKLLNHALDLLPKGGKLVYAVCSLQPEEGEYQINKLLNEKSDVSLIPITSGVLAPYTTPYGWIRTLPCHKPENGGMDGFFAALLVKGG
ncbi:MAG: RsmB/NOP family class I SAM-dependent RNA methyltransferase [Alphaproteobacteria bacterium]